MIGKLYPYREEQQQIISNADKVLCPECYRVLPVSDEKRGQMLIAGATFVTCVNQNILVRVWLYGLTVITKTEAQYITELLSDRGEE